MRTISVKVFWFRRFHFKIFLIQISANPFLGVAKPFVQFWIRHHDENNFEKYFEFGPVVQEMSFKYIAYL